MEIARVLCVAMLCCALATAGAIPQPIREKTSFTLFNQVIEDEFAYFWNGSTDARAVAYAQAEMDYTAQYFQSPSLISTMEALKYEFNINTPKVG